MSTVILWCLWPAIVTGAAFVLERRYGVRTIVVLALGVILGMAILSVAVTGFKPVAPPSRSPLTALENVSWTAVLFLLVFGLPAFTTLILALGLKGQRTWLQWIVPVLGGYSCALLSGIAAASVAISVYGK